MSEFLRLKEECGRQHIPCTANAPLSPYTSFRIGGPAALLLQPQDAAQLAAAVRLCREGEIPCFILGKGSNLLVDDAGLSRAVILTTGIKYIEKTGENGVRCGCGVTLSALCDFAAANALGGLEFAFGIPGTVGGAVFMNAGAYGGEIKDVLRSCQYLDMQGNLLELDAAHLDLRYRHSVFAENGGIVLAAEFALVPGDEVEIRQNMRETMEKRRSKQPLNYPSAGSVFKRPPGQFAAALIEQCGLKGLRVGGACVSEKHSGFIVNTGGATAKDVRELISRVREGVQTQTGTLLETEVLFVSDEI